MKTHIFLKCLEVCRTVNFDRTMKQNISLLQIKLELATLDYKRVNLFSDYVHMTGKLPNL